MKSNKLLTFLFLSLITSHYSLTTSLSAGTGKSGASFLKISPGARPVGMGGAYTAISNDINCLYYNPAGMRNMNQTVIGAMHTEWIAGMNYEFAGGIIPSRLGPWGLSAIYLNTGEMEGRSADRSATGDFTASDVAVSLSHARMLKSNLFFGSSFKIIRQIIADETAEGIAIDIGINWKMGEGRREMVNGRREKGDGKKGIEFGLAIRNLGPKMEFIEEQFSLPLTITAGAGYNIIDPFKIALDVSYEPIDDRKSVRLGTEFVPFGFMSLRAGYLIKAIETLYSGNINDSSPLESKGLSGGIGFSIYGYNLDYAIVPYRELGTTHRVSFQAKF